MDRLPERARAILLLWCERSVAILAWKGVDETQAEWRHALSVWKKETFTKITRYSEEGPQKISKMKKNTIKTMGTENLNHYLLQKMATRVVVFTKIT